MGRVLFPSYGIREKGVLLNGNKQRIERNFS